MAVSDLHIQLLRDCGQSTREIGEMCVDLMDGVCCLVKRGGRLVTLVALLDLARFRPFPPLFGRPVVLSYTAYPLVPAPLPLPSSHGRTPKNFQTSLAAYQPKFYPRYGDRPREDGQECRKDPRPHPEWRQGQGPWCRPQRRRDRHPRWDLFPSQPRPTRRRTCKSVRFRTGSVPSALFFYRLSPPSSSPSHILEALGAISRCFGDRQCCGPGATVACRWFALIRPRAFAPNPQPWTPLLTMSITGYRQREQEYGLPLIFPPRRPWPR